VDDDCRGYLFRPSEESLSDGALAYIRRGEDAKVDQAYKCRSRSPWWRVPAVRTPDLFLTYMDHERPRLVTNAARVDILNSLYGVCLLTERRKLGCDLLPLAMLNSITLLTAETVGRAYGGGLLKLEPKEADRLVVPSLDLVDSSAKELRQIRAQAAKALRRGATLEAVKLVDRVLLTGTMGVAYSAIRSLREAREVLFLRRVTRGKGMRESN
jgi:adenine-specific DNA-methyltransferase